MANKLHHRKTQLPATRTMPKSQDDQPLLDEHSDSDSEQEEKIPEAAPKDTRFNPPPPSPWKRLALILFVGLLFYFGFQLRAGLQHKKPQIVYASRYSKEHKFRPAASPVITETLKDGRIRLRGATPPPTTTPTPSSPPKRRRRSGQAGRASGKAKRKKSPAAARL